MTTAYGCCGQALTRFTGHPRTGPGRQPASAGEPAYAPSTPDAHDPSPTPTRTLPHMPGSPRNHDDAPASAKSIALLLVRVFFVVLVVVVAALYVLKVNRDAGAPSSTGSPFTNLDISLIVGGALVFSLVVLAIDLATPRKKISTLSGVFLGLLAGVLASVATSFLIDLAAQGYQFDKSPIVPTVKIVLSTVLCYLAVAVVLQTQDDFRLIIPYVEFSKQRRGARPLILDTSALIDGRILETLECGLSQSPVVIPSFVIQELQTLADASDRAKRAKGRRGLDLVSRLQRSPRLVVAIDESDVDGVSVDQRVIDLARREGGAVITTDSGLARVAAIHDVPVVNLNSLAASLRPSVSTGESLSIKVVKPGEQPGQGVGYLEDGTMIVVENGATLIGEEVGVIVTGALQTSAGRLVFARAADADTDTPHTPSDVADAPINHTDDTPTSTDTVTQPERRDRDGPLGPRRPSHGRTPRNPRRH